MRYNNGNNKRALWLPLVVMSLLSAACGALAAAPPQLTVLEMGQPRAGALKDGVQLGQGVVVSQEGHSGFQVWSDVQATGADTTRYILTGSQNGTNTLRVRLENNNWSAAPAGGKGIVTTVTDTTATFRVVADGNQQVVADQYPLVLSAAVLSTPAGGGAAEVSAPDTRTLSININAALALTHTLTQAQSAFSGTLQDNRLMATGTVKAQDSSTWPFAVRWAPVSGDITGNRNVVHSKDNASNRVAVRLEFAGAQAQTDGWYTAPAATELNYTVRADGAQTVPAGTYTLTLEASVWVE